MNTYQRETFREIRDNYVVTTGIITRYNVESKLSIPSRGLSKTKNGLSFQYDVNGKAYNNSYQENPFIAIPDLRPNITHQYIVLYQKDDPQNSCLLLNYPVINETEKKLYLKQFQNELPADAFLQ